MNTKFDLDISEKDLSEEDLLEAEELFFTNAISGIRWASSFSSKNYTNIIATSLHRQLTLLWK